MGETKEEESPEFYLPTPISWVIFPIMNTGKTIYQFLYV